MEDTVYLVNEDSSKTFLARTSSMIDANTYISTLDQGQTYSVEYADSDGNITVLF